MGIWHSGAREDIWQQGLGTVSLETPENGSLMIKTAVCGETAFGKVNKYVTPGAMAALFQPRKAKPENGHVERRKQIGL